MNIEVATRQLRSKHINQDLTSINLLNRESDFELHTIRKRLQIEVKLESEIRGWGFFRLQK